MRTVTTVEHVEKKDSGAYVVTFLGNNKAGTFDAELGEVAVKAHAEDAAVELQVRKDGGKLFIERLAIIEPPDELGGPSEIAPEVPVQAGELDAAALVEPFGPMAAAEEATNQGDETDPPLSLATDAQLLDELESRLRGANDG